MYFYKQRENEENERKEIHRENICFNEVLKHKISEPSFPFDEIILSFGKKEFEKTTKLFSILCKSIDVTTEPIKSSVIPLEFWSCCSNYLSEFSKNKLLVKKMLVCLGNLIPRVNADDFTFFELSKLVTNLCKMRPITSAEFRVSVYVISTIIDHNVCFEEFIENFPLNKLDSFIANDESSNEISRLFLVLSKHQENEEIVDLFSEVFRKYMEKSEKELSAQMILLVSKYYKSERFFTQEMREFLLTLLKRTSGTARTALIDVFRELATEYKDMFIPEIPNVYESMITTTLQEDSLFEKGCMFMTVMIRHLGLEFPRNIVHALMSEIANRLRLRSIKYFESYLTCALIIVVYSDVKETISFIEENGIHEIAFDILSINDKRLSIQALRLLIEMRKTLELAENTSILDDFINEEIVDSIYELMNSSDEILRTTSYQFFEVFDIDQDSEETD